MNTIHIFCGPTIPKQEVISAFIKSSVAESIIAQENIIILPPVAEGDVYRSVLKKPAIIGIIDGYFGNLPSVWHKEILFAMKQGIHVFGSSSMGALRAAELHAFGMIGCGKIYQDYASGILEDDDEVAVVHAPAEVGYSSLSEAMVNIRYTLDKAVTNNVITQKTHRMFIDIAKKQYYPKRTYESVIKLFGDLGGDFDEITKLQTWLQQNKIDQKRLDALEMVDTIKKLLQKPLVTKSVSYYFEHTSFWDRSIKRHQS